MKGARTRSVESEKTMLIHLLVTAALQAAPAAPPAAEPKMATLAKAFSGCLRGQIRQVPATLSPEEGADWTFQKCETERAAIAGEVESMIAGAPEEQKVAARAELAKGLAEGRRALVDGIVALRQAGAGR